MLIYFYTFLHTTVVRSFFHWSFSGSFGTIVGSFFVQNCKMQLVQAWNFLLSVSFLFVILGVFQAKMTLFFFWNKKKEKVLSMLCFTCHRTSLETIHELFWELSIKQHTLGPRIVWFWGLGKSRIKWISH